MKKRVVLTLDANLVEAVKAIQNDSRGSKFSPLVNNLLLEHPEIKKRLKKK